MDGQLAVEVALLGGGADLEDDADGDHDSDEEEAHAVDDHLQVGVVGWRVVGDGWMVEGRGGGVISVIAEGLSFLGFFFKTQDQSHGCSD